MKKIVMLVWALSTLFFVGCGGLDKPVAQRVNGGEVLADVDAVTMKGILKQLNIAKDDTVVYGYKAYKIKYETTDEENNKVQASGLMVVPTGMPEAVKQIGYSLVSDDHGTIFANDETSTVVAEKSYAPAGSSVVLTSLGGFVTIQPDYIGFGDSNSHYHPFILKKSLANATVDFIKAARKFAQANEIKLNGQLFLTGYSEGGYAAMATLQKIEQEGTLQVSMAAPMAGPYALDAMAMGVLSSPTLTVPSFMANVAYAYAKAYSKDIANIINEPYASKLEGLIDGSRTRAAIDPELTTVTTGPTGLFRQDLVGDFFQNPQNWFKKAVQENDIHAWVPQTAVRLIHCKGDHVIPFQISELTEGTMKAMGAQNVALVPVEETLGQGSALVGHGQCGMMAYQVATGAFAQVRKATIGY